MAKVVVYSKDGCSFCLKAKRLLTSKNIGFEEVDLAYESQDNIRKLVAQTGTRSIPQIFVDDQFIGGFNELQKLIMEDKLK